MTEVRVMIREVKTTRLHSEQSRQTLMRQMGQAGVRWVFYFNALIIICVNFCYGQSDSLRLIATLTGDSTGDQFSVVAGVGDVNGDGYDDFLVGAPGGNYAKLYFGGSTFDTIPDLIFHGENQGRFGYSIAGGKDLNGDGYPDFAIGAPNYCFGGCVDGIADAGKAYVYFGGPQLDTIPDMEFLSVGWYNHFGHAVAMASDLNKDGYPDLIVGVPNYGGDAHGRVFIYYGGPATFDSTADVVLDGEHYLDMFGYSVSDAGDVNKDGYGDLIVGAPQDLRGLAGKAYLIFGRDEGMTLDSSITFWGDTAVPYGSFGRVVAGLGDVNGDGFGDFGSMGLHETEIIMGDSIIANYRTVYISERTERGEFVFLSHGGDLNSDGLGEVLVSTEKNNNVYTGSVIALFGKPEFDTTNQYEVDVPLSGLSFGSSIDFTGKVSDKAKHTIAIGDDRVDGWQGAGEVYLYSYGTVDAVIEEEHFPKGFELYQNYPNPFNPITKIEYALPVTSNVKLRIYNILGQEVIKLVDEIQEPGFKMAQWNSINNYGSTVASGIYFYRLTTKYGSTQKPMILIR